MSRICTLHMRVLLLLPLFCCCQNVKRNKNFSGTEMYDLANPKVIKLPSELDEISGLAYYAKDTSVFAIVDEDGILYKIPLKNAEGFKEWTFDKKRDYEDLILKDSVFYVLVSNGDIVTVQFSGNKLTAVKLEYPDASKKVNEFEALYNDDSKIIIICKDCEADPKGFTSSFVFDLKDSSKLFSDYLKFNLQSVLDKEGKGKHLKISAAAINPVTGDLYLISSIHHVLVITGRNGEVKNSYKLDPSIYNQAEGIAFTPSGDLIISNEKGATPNATLLLLKNKLKK